MEKITMQIQILRLWCKDCSAFVACCIVSVSRADCNTVTTVFHNLRKSLYKTTRWHWELASSAQRLCPSSLRRPSTMRRNRPTVSYALPDPWRPTRTKVCPAGFYSFWGARPLMKPIQKKGELKLFLYWCLEWIEFVLPFVDACWCCMCFH